MAAQSYTFLVSFPAFTRWHAILEGLDILPAMNDGDSYGATR